MRALLLFVKFPYLHYAFRVNATPVCESRQQSVLSERFDLGAPPSKCSICRLTLHALERVFYEF
jgi:hypothetical protein